MRLYHEDTEGGVHVHVMPVVVGLLLMAALIFGIVAAIWGLGVATAGIYGRGQQIKQVNSSDNRTFQYDKFFNLYADVRAQTVQVRNTQAAIASTTDPSEHTRLASVLLGLENLCQQNVQTYNQDARKIVTGGQFRSHNLPDALPDGPDSNCGG